MGSRSHAEKMTRHSEFANPERKAYRQHPGASLLAEWMGEGHPLLPEVVRELMRLQGIGVELTRAVVAELIELVEARYAGIELPRRPVVAPRAALAPLRFGHIPTGQQVVYYMRVGNRIKIGTTSSLRSRLAAISPEELMATELGGSALERHRHAQFRDLRTEGEWFRYEGVLFDHIASLVDDTEPRSLDI